MSTARTDDATAYLATYLGAVARELRYRGITAQAEPASGRLIVHRPPADGLPSARLVVVWHAKAGWAALWAGESDTWAHVVHPLVDEPDAAPATVACLVSDLIVT